MIKVVLSQEAKEDLTETGDYIAYQLRNKAAARNFVARIRTAVTSLAQFPGIRYAAGLCRIKHNVPLFGLRKLFDILPSVRKHCAN